MLFNVHRILHFIINFYTTMILLFRIPAILICHKLMECFSPDKDRVKGQNLSGMCFDFI
jgi:hypothetical protein